MADILPFKKTKASEKHRGKTLCRNGHHAWEVLKSSSFDVKSGKLVTVLRCKRCEATRHRLL